MRGAAALGMLALAVAASVGVVAQQGPGVQRGRPGAGRSPEFPVPSITDYKPRNTLKVPQHPTPRAKFPVIDIHSHQPTPISPEQFAKVVEGMDANNLRVLQSCRLSQGQYWTWKPGSDQLRNEFANLGPSLSGAFE